MFYYNSRKPMQEAIRLLEEFDGSELRWRGLQDIGISQKAFDTVKANNIDPKSVFSHPMAIFAEPKLVLYYRNLACLPQKGIRHFGLSVEKIEKGSSISHQKAIAFSSIVNSITSAFIETDPTYSPKDVNLLLGMAYGAQMEGAWRNIVGKKGAQHIKQIMLGYFRERGVIKSLKLKKGEIVSAQESPTVDSLNEIILTNDYSVRFAADPDIEIKNKTGTPWAVIEIKSGTDMAGAFERYGAAKKSFSKALKKNKAVDTIYIAHLTPSVIEAMENDQLVKTQFEITDVMANRPARAAFLERVLWLAHLSCNDNN